MDIYVSICHYCGQEKEVELLLITTMGDEGSTVVACRDCEPSLFWSQAEWDAYNATIHIPADDELPF